MKFIELHLAPNRDRILINITAIRTITPAAASATTYIEVSSGEEGSWKVVESYDEVRSIISRAIETSS
jgi:hypothetical protein